MFIVLRIIIKVQNRNYRMHRIVSEVNREDLDVRECKRMWDGKSKQIEKALFLFQIPVYTKNLFRPGRL